MTYKLVIGVIIAAAGWAAMFLPRREGFWTRAAVAGGAIAIYAVAADPGAIGHQFARPHWYADLLVGLASGAVLYAVFWVGEQILVILLPTLAAEVGDLYAVRGRTEAWFMPLVLVIAAPAEELFFRGLLWHRAGVLIGLAVYGAVHLPERKVILVLAALVGGAWWGVLFSWTGGLVAPVASHLLWIFAIVLWHPAQPTAWARRVGARLRDHPAR